MHSQTLKTNICFWCFLKDCSGEISNFSWWRNFTLCVTEVLYVFCLGENPSARIFWDDVQARSMKLFMMTLSIEICACLSFCDTGPFSRSQEITEWKFLCFGFWFWFWVWVSWFFLFFFILFLLFWRCSVYSQILMYWSLTDPVLV